MVRYLTAAALGCLYVAFSSWLVRSEGEAYRKALRLERLGAPRIGTEPRSPSSKAIATETAVVGTKPVPSPATAAATPTPPGPPAALPAPGDLVAKAVTKAATPASRPEPHDVKSLRPLAPVWADTLDLAHLTAEQERRLGADLHALVLETNREDESGEYVERIVRAARPLLDTVTRKDIKYTFTVLDSDRVNAFSFPGGFVYVCRGLFDLIASDEDYGLQFVLGHEIAHVDLKHALKCVAPSNAEAKKRDIDTLRQFMLPIGLGFPDEQEFEADAWAYRRMTTRLNRSLRQSLAFLRKFQGYSRTNGFVNGRKPPDPKSSFTMVENHFRAHPAAWDRLDRLKVPAVKPR